MTDLTSEQAALYEKLMADAEGKKIRREWDQYSIKYIAVPDYEHDLNALARVVRVICKTERGRDALSCRLIDAFQASKTLYCFEIWYACLTAEELFQIIGKVLKTLKDTGIERAD